MELNKIIYKQIILENIVVLFILIIFKIILVWESMIKGGFFTSQTANKSDQDLSDPLGKYLL